VMEVNLTLSCEEDEEDEEEDEEEGEARTINQSIINIIFIYNTHLYSYQHQEGMKL
jgi:hypothetical protein